MELIIVCIVGLALAIFAYKKKLLTAGAAGICFFSLFLIDLFGKWPMVLLILWTFVTISVIDKVFAKRQEQQVKGIHEKKGRRSCSQIWINIGAAVLCIILYGVTGRMAFMIGYIVAIGESYADSLGSDVGVLSSRPPVDICSFKPVTNGLSGGISFLGSAASTVGVLLYTALYAVVSQNKSVVTLVLIVLSCLSGCIIDSILGSKLQVKYRCRICGAITEKREHCNTETERVKGLHWMNNSAVNLISNVVVTVLAVLIYECAIAKG